MLVLSRHENEAIVIGGRIKVTVVKIRGHQIRLGIEAPKDVAVRRDELRRLGQKGKKNLDGPSSHATMN